MLLAAAVIVAEPGSLPRDTLSVATVIDELQVERVGDRAAASQAGSSTQ